MDFWLKLRFRHYILSWQFRNIGLFRISPAQSLIIGISWRRAPDFQTINLLFFTRRDIHERNTIALLQRIASQFLTTSNKEKQTLLAGLFCLLMKTDSHKFLTLLQSQIWISSLKRYDGELLMKFQSLFAPSNLSLLLQILYFALYHLSNNLLLEKETDKFLQWLIEHQQNELFVSFLKT